MHLITEPYVSAHFLDIDEKKLDQTDYWIRDTNRNIDTVIPIET